MVDQIAAVTFTRKATAELQEHFQDHFQAVVNGIREANEVIM